MEDVHHSSKNRSAPIEADLFNDMLGCEDRCHDPEDRELEHSDDDESEDTSEIWNGIEDAHLTGENDEEHEDDMNEDQGNSDPEIHRNLSHLKPWQKTLSEFVVGHMAHNPCGTNIPGGTKRRCWIGGKCKVCKMFLSFH